MKELDITQTMKRLQNQARGWYANGKKIDADAVEYGWKIAPGRVIVDDTIGATITILSETQKYQWNAYVVCPSKDVDREMLFNVNQIGKMILGNNATVYYSK